MNMFNYKKFILTLLCFSFGNFLLISKSWPGWGGPTLEPTNRSLPIVYHKNYNIGFFGIEKMHPFDTQKFKKIVHHLQQACGIFPQELQTPHKVTDDELQQVHTPGYLAALRKSSLVAAIAEVAPLRYLPNFLLQRNMLDGMRYATGGTILGAQLALQKGWAINLGGGYHHAKAYRGEGFCFFADIPLAIKKLRETNQALKVLVVDLDAHQGNGLEAILGHDTQTSIFDMYSKYNYPSDQAVRQYIDFDYPLPTNIKDQEYLTLLKKELPKAIAQSKPDLIIYNAGSDVFEKDPLGKMSISKEGIIERDAFLFSQAFDNKKPILMVLSGGYSPESAEIVGSSIENILKKFKLVNPRPQTKASLMRAGKPQGKAFFKKV